jgi:TonB family protein
MATANQSPDWAVWKFKGELSSHSLSFPIYFSAGDISMGRELKRQILTWIFLAMITGISQRAGSVQASDEVSATENVDFGPFMDKLQKDIKRAWFPPRGAESKRIGVTFKVCSNGEVMDLRLSKSSGDKAADDAAILAVQKAQPFASLPVGAPQNVEIQFAFDYSVFTGKSKLINELNNIETANAIDVLESKKIPSQQMNGTAIAKPQIQKPQAKSSSISAEIQALSKLIRQKPNDLDLYLARAFYQLANNSIRTSYEDARKILVKTPSQTNTKEERRLQLSLIILCLWAETDNNKNAEAKLLAQARNNCKKNQWPYPIIRYLSGEINESSIKTTNENEKIEKLVLLGFRKVIENNSKQALAYFNEVDGSPSYKPLAGSNLDFKKIARAMISKL